MMDDAIRFQQLTFLKILNGGHDICGEEEIGER